VALKRRNSAITDTSVVATTIVDADSSSTCKQNEGLTRKENKSNRAGYSEQRRADSCLVPRLRLIALWPKLSFVLLLLFFFWSHNDIRLGKKLRSGLDVA
jgi:hypothetical protein